MPYMLEFFLCNVPIKVEYIKLTFLCVEDVKNCIESFEKSYLRENERITQFNEPFCVINRPFALDPTISRKYNDMKLYFKLNLHNMMTFMMYKGRMFTDGHEFLEWIVLQLNPEIIDQIIDVSGNTIEDNNNADSNDDADTSKLLINNYIKND